MKAPTLMGLCFAAMCYSAAAAAAEATVTPAQNASVEAAPTAEAANDTTQSQAAAARSRQIAEVPVYVPPRRGAPQTRVGGGTRTVTGAAGADEILLVLAPPQTGFTRQAQPTLYWFLSTADPGPFEFVLIAADAVAPLWRQRVDGPLTAGIHAIALDRTDVALEPGVEYQWSVAIVRDAARRSRDLVASGTLQRIDVPTPPDEEVDAVFALAAEGLWYDALQQLGDAIATDAASPRLQRYRRALLQQADLAEVSNYLDRSQPVADQNVR